MPHILGPCLRLISSSVQLGCPSHDSSGHNGHTFGRYPKPSSLGQSLRVIIWQLRHPPLAVLCLKLFQKAPRGSSRQHKKGGRAWQGSKRDWLEFCDLLTRSYNQKRETLGKRLQLSSEICPMGFTIRSDRTPCAWLSALVAPGDDELPMGSPCKTPG